jgi:hypothetical protein
VHAPSRGRREAIELARCTANCTPQPEQPFERFAAGTLGSEMDWQASRTNRTPPQSPCPIQACDQVLSGSSRRLIKAC